ncbi:MAG: hypothetical protein G8D91_17900 [gamma proteobacterium symbiont of Clathrolucina costata]
MKFRDRLHRLAVFYEAQDSTIKSLGRDARLRFLLGDPQPVDDAYTARCRQLTLYPEPSRIAAMRGAGDTKAVRGRYGVPTVLPDCSDSSRRACFLDGMEQIRTELCAARRLPGVRMNLAARQQRVSSEEGISSVILHARHVLDVPGGGVAHKDPKLVQSIKDELAGLVKVLEQPVIYHRQVARIAEILQFDTEHAPGLALDFDNDSDADDRETSSLHMSQQPVDDPDVSLQKSETGVALDECYRVFNRGRDQEVDATELASRDELDALREHMDAELRASRVSLSRLAGRLLNTLTTPIRMEWESDYDDGLLDLERLDRLIMDPLYPLAHRRRRVRSRHDTLVCLLVDNSGSMRGRPITVAALCADMLSRTLERCGIGTEVLGYTTRYWRGGELWERWKAQGQVKLPGRLNALRHIVYKSADRPWRRARKALALMLDTDLLKENIDGEALLWAHGRLVSRPEARKVLIVISDGAPLGEATEKANGESYLCDHLQQVITEVERRSTVELMAIGIGHDVSAYYRNAVVIPSEVSLGDILVDQLCTLLGEQGGNSRRSKRQSSVWSGATRNAVSL